jgi:hypothetical protein
MQQATHVRAPVGACGRRRDLLCGVVGSSRPSRGSHSLGEMYQSTGAPPPSVVLMACKPVHGNASHALDRENVFLLSTVGPRRCPSVVRFCLRV